MAGTVGLTVIVAVMGIIIYQSVAAGLPAIKNGELPLWKLEVRFLPPCFSTAFYTGHNVCQSSNIPATSGHSMLERASQPGRNASASALNPFSGHDGWTSHILNRFKALKCFGKHPYR